MGDDIHRVVEVSDVCALVVKLGTRGLLLAGAAVCYCYTQTENIKHIAQRVMSACTVRMISTWVVATCHSPRDLAHVSVTFVTEIISLSVDYRLERTFERTCECNRECTF